MSHKRGFGGMSDGDREDATESGRRQDSREYADVLLLKILVMRMTNYTDDKAMRKWKM
jgi:hypothetical protein